MSNQLGPNKINVYGFGRDRTKKYPAILGPVYLDTVRNGWGGTNSTLQQYLAIEGEYLILQVKGSNRYVQFMDQGRYGMRMETVSDYYLPEGDHLSEEDYLGIIGRKTAALTACCCRLGAYFARAEANGRGTSAAHHYVSRDSDNCTHRYGDDGSPRYLDDGAHSNRGANFRTTIPRNANPEGHERTASQSLRRREGA